jgi:hypothetical protein
MRRDGDATLEKICFTARRNSHGRRGARVPSPFGPAGETRRDAMSGFLGSLDMSFWNQFCIPLPV